MSSVIVVVEGSAHADALAHLHRLPDALLLLLGFLRVLRDLVGRHCLLRLLRARLFLPLEHQPQLVLRLAGFALFVGLAVGSAFGLISRPGGEPLESLPLIFEELLHLLALLGGDDEGGYAVAVAGDCGLVPDGGHVVLVVLEFPLERLYLRSLVHANILEGEELPVDGVDLAAPLLLDAAHLLAHGGDLGVDLDELVVRVVVLGGHCGLGEVPDVVEAGDLALELVQPGLELGVGGLGALVEVERGGGLRVDGLVVLQRLLLLPLLPPQRLLLARQPLALPAQERHLVLLVADLVVLVVCEGGLDSPDVLLEAGDDALLLLGLGGVTLGDLLGLLEAGPLVSGGLLDDRVDHGLQLEHLGQQFAVLEHQARAVAQGHVQLLALLLQARLPHHFYLLFTFPIFSHPKQQPHITHCPTYHASCPLPLPSSTFSEVLLESCLSLAMSRSRCGHSVLARSRRHFRCSLTRPLTAFLSSLAFSLLGRSCLWSVWKGLAMAVLACSQSWGFSLCSLAISANTLISVWLSAGHISSRLAASASKWMMLASPRNNSSSSSSEKHPQECGAWMLVESNCALMLRRGSVRSLN